MSNLSKQGKLAKVFTVATSFATVLSMSGVMYLAPTALAVAPADYGLHEGDVVSAAGSDDPDVYIVNELGYKRLFLNPAIFNFYGHLGGFAAVKNISAATRDAFGTSGLFRNCETNDQKVYGVETTGEDTGILHWVNTTGAQAVMDDANFFKKVFCINNNEFSWYSKGSDYTSVNQVPNYSRTPVSTGPISVSLASNNPVAGTIVDTQARYNLANFMFSGTSAVTAVKLKRTGVSADASLTNVYLYDGVKRLTDSATVSDGVIYFNDTAGLFTVSGSKIISVMADVDGSAGETIGVQVYEVNGTAVGPVSGNLHTIATATLATLSLAAVTSPTDGNNDEVDDDNGNTAPADDVIGWQDTVTVGQRYVWLKSLQLRVVGSVVTGDLQNFRLYVDGVQVGSAVSQQDSSGYIVFDMSGSPVKLETGGRVFKILVNIVGGSNKEFHLSLRQKPDIWAVDSQYNAAVLATTTDQFPIGDVDNDIEVDTGDLTFTKKTDSPSGDVVKDASGVVLARYEVKATGEKMKVENLHISNDSTNSAGTASNHLALRNAALFLDNVQIGSTTTLWEDDATASDSDGEAEVTLGSSMIVTPGTPRILEIRADIYDASGTNGVAADDTITANIETSSSNVQRLTTLDYVTKPATVTSGNQLTVKTGSFTAAKYTGYANQSIVAPKTAAKIGHYTLAAASSEDVAVNTVTLDGQSAYGGSGTLTSDFTDTYLKVWNDAGAVVYTSAAKTTFSNTASNSYSVNFTIPKNKTWQIEVWANVASTFAAADSMRTNMDASGTTVGSSTSVTAAQVNGQTISGATGAFTLANGTIPVANFVQGGLTKNVYNFTITPTYDDYYLDEVYVDISSTVASSTGAVASLNLKEGANLLRTATLDGVTGSASFTGLNLSLPQTGGTRTFSVDVQFSGVGVGSNDTGGAVTLRLDGYKNRNSSGTITTRTGLAPASYTANNQVDVKGYPTFTNSSLPTTAMAAGTNTLFKTVVSATGGQIAWNEITFTVSSTSAGVSTIDTFKLFENGVEITADATASNTVGSANQRVQFSFATERIISSGNSVTLELKATVGGTLTAADTLTTTLAQGLGSTVSTEDSTTQRAKNSSFIWTDQSSPSHSTTTDDWFTDGLIKTIAEAQTLTK